MKFMSHLVLGYPSMEESLKTAEAYIAAGHAVLELQIPFSHPTADGPVITQACRAAVEGQRATVDNCLEAIALLRQRFPDQEIMVMSYLNRMFAYGLVRFGQAMTELGVKHLIVPDLPVDSPLANNLKGITLVPVLAANITAERLDTLLDLDFDFFYLMSGFKITGSEFSLHPGLKAVIKAIKERKPSARVGIGFGIGNAEQVKAVWACADYAIVGSALIRAQAQGRLSEVLADLAN